MTSNDPPSEQQIARINAEHLITTPLRPADLLFVFGQRRGAQQIIDAAVGLWHRRLFRHAIVSGGATQGDPRTECSVIKGGMVEGGVPAGLILEEHRASNTGENVIFSLPVIDAALGRHTIRSVICLGKICTARRYPMTLQRHWPEVAKMLVTVNPYDAPVERWHTDPVFRERVLAEWHKIAPYQAQGFIAEWP
ncbi:MAG: YdcF family protein [Rhodospirillales bacterium]|nr:YdcF family protein [Rhodospirillales bacterium]